MVSFSCECKSTFSPSRCQEARQLSSSLSPSSLDFTTYSRRPPCLVINHTVQNRPHYIHPTSLTGPPRGFHSTSVHSNIEGVHHLGLQFLVNARAALPLRDIPPYHSAMPMFDLSMAHALGRSPASSCPFPSDGIETPLARVSAVWCYDNHSTNIVLS